jgi:hypothetical protein
MLEALKGDRWTDKTARLILPVLIWCAKNGQVITYDQLNRWIVDNKLGHSVLQPKYGWPAGAVGMAMIELEEKWEDAVPPLNALVVNAKSGLPGDGAYWYLERYRRNTSELVDRVWEEAEEELIEEIHEAIFSYAYWDDVLEASGLDSEEIDPGFFDEDELEVSLPGRGGWSSEGESDEHKALKRYISEHPESLGFDVKGVNTNQQEYLFASADRADVVLGVDNKIWGIEVKSCISNVQDLNRGIFQAVKYRALLRAEQRAKGLPPTAYGVLVVERDLPEELQNLADILEIEVCVVKVNI